jgi:asparaginyl-tRNA synthetase
VFVSDYPKDIKAFYMRNNDDQETVASFDLLVPGMGELIGGSQREERYELLLQKIIRANLNPADYSWYLDTRRYLLPLTHPLLTHNTDTARFLMQATDWDSKD